MQKQQNTTLPYERLIAEVDESTKKAYRNMRSKICKIAWVYRKAAKNNPLGKTFLIDGKCLTVVKATPCEPIPADGFPLWNVETDDGMTLDEWYPGEAEMKTREIAMRAAAASINGQAEPCLGEAIREAEAMLQRDLKKEERATIDKAVKALGVFFKDWIEAESD